MLAYRDTIRREIRQQRRQLSPSAQQQAATALCARLTSLPLCQTAKTIAVYLANDGEIDLAPFIAWCWRQNKSVYLPVLHPFSRGNLLFLRYSEDTQLQHNKFGIAEPKLAVTDVLPASQLDLLITPLVAFDDSGNRLGMGGGFYDRTLVHWFHADVDSPYYKLNPIGVAHDCQHVDQLPVESWDIPLTKIVTPSACHSWNIRR